MPAISVARHQVCRFERTRSDHRRADHPNRRDQTVI
jgi:hypothetical protein